MLAGYEEPVLLGVIGDAVEDIFYIRQRDFARESAQINPAGNPPRGGRDARNPVGLPDIGVDFALDIFKLI
jgi:hypothetical protein